jgi:hypothetical protein
MDGDRLHPEARRLVEDALRAALWRWATRMAAGAGVLGVMGVGVWYSVVKTAREAAVNAAVVEAQAQSAETFRQTVQALAQQHAMAMIDVGRVRRELEEIAREMEEARTEAAAIRKEQESVTAAAKEAAEKAKAEALAILDQVSATRGSAEAMGKRLAELDKTTKELSERVLGDGVRSLQAFLDRIGTDSRLKDVADLARRVDGIGAWLDASSGQIKCTSLAVQQAGTSAPLVRLGSTASGGGLVDVLDAKGRLRLRSGATGNDGEGLIAAYRSEGGVSCLLAQDSGDGPGRMALYGTGGSIIAHIGSMGVDSVGLQVCDPSGLIGAQLLTTRSASASCGEAEFRRDGSRYLSIGLGAGDSSSGVWIYRKGVENHVATLQDHPDGGVVMLRNPRTGLERSLSAQQK